MNIHIYNSVKDLTVYNKLVKYKRKKIKHVLSNIVGNLKHVKIIKALG